MSAGCVPGRAGLHAGLEQGQDSTALLSWSLHSSRESGKKPTDKPNPDLEDFIEGSTQSVRQKISITGLGC